MNKRQRKKQSKKKLSKYIMGIDLGIGQDYTVMIDTTARFIYNKFGIPAEYINKQAEPLDLLYKEFLQRNRIVLKG